MRYVGRFEGQLTSVGTRTAGVNNPLRNPLAVEGSKHVNKMDILEKERPPFAGSLSTKRLGLWPSSPPCVCEIRVVEGRLLLLAVDALEKVGFVDIVLCIGVEARFGCSLQAITIRQCACH